MKKIVLCVLCVLLGACIGVTSGWLIWYEEPVEHFTYSDYTYLEYVFQQRLSGLPTTGLDNVGEIRNAEDAVEKAHVLLQEKYEGDWNNQEYEWTEEFDLYVRYEGQLDLWFVSGSYKEDNVMGVAPQVLFRGNGDVVGVWLG